MNVSRIVVLFLVMSVVVLVGCKKTPVAQNENAVAGTQTVNEANEEGNADENNEEIGTDTKTRRYLIPQAVITYSVKGTIPSGKETLTFDNYGARERRETELEIDFSGFKTTIHTVVITKDTRTVSYNVQTRQGVTFINDLIDTMEIDEEDTGEVKGNLTSSIQFGTQLLEKIGAVKDGTKMVLDKQCAIRTIEKMGSTVCLREGIALEQRISKEDQVYEQVATSIVTNGIEEASFEVPADITFEEVDTPVAE